MNAAEFEPWRKEVIDLYAQERMRSQGLSEEAAQQVAWESFEALLADGLSTPDQFVFQILEKKSDAVVGTLWFGLRKEGELRKAFLYDLILKKEYRGLGYGDESLRLLETEVRKLGLKHIGLHVFGHNQRARHLYEKLGYHPVSIVMQKELP